MTRLLTSGAETVHPSCEPVILAGDANISTQQKHSGWCSFKIGDIGIEGGRVDISNGTYVGARWGHVPGRWYYSRCWMMVVAPEVSNEIIMAVYHNTVPVQNFVLVSDGTLHRDSAAGPLLASGIDYYQWFCFEVGVWCDGVTQRRVILRLNGVQIDNIITTDVLTNLGNEVRFGIINPHVSRATGRNFWMDDIAVNDDTGSENNSWPGVNGKIVVTFPESDVAVGANWKGGNGTNASPGSIWQRVSGAPPRGIAPTDPDANFRQMRDAVPSSVDNADIQLESYEQYVQHVEQLLFDVRITSVQLLCSAAREGTAGLQAKLLSSPAGETVTINPPSEPPGAYPDRWSFARSAHINGSSIDSSIGPVVRLNKLAGSSGIAYCCQALVQFEYEHASASSDFKRKFLCVV